MKTFEERTWSKAYQLEVTRTCDRCGADILSKVETYTDDWFIAQERHESRYPDDCSTEVQSLTWHFCKVCWEGTVVPAIQAITYTGPLEESTE